MFSANYHDRRHRTDAMLSLVELKFIVLLNNQPGVLLADTDVISSSNPGSLRKIPRDYRHIIEMLPLTLNKYLIQHELNTFYASH